MSGKKVISLSPELLNPRAGKKQKRTRKQYERKRKPIQQEVRPNTLKKALLKKIKEHQKRQSDKKPNEELTTGDNSKNDNVKLMMKEKAKPKEEFSESSFNSSLKYLNEISKKQKNQKNSHRKSKKERREARKLQKKQQKQMQRSRKHIIRPQTAPPQQPLQATLPQTTTMMPTTSPVAPQVPVYDAPPPAIVPNLVEVKDLKPSGTITITGAGSQTNHNKTLKAPVQVFQEPPQELTLPPPTTASEPPYSNLKNGSKPSYKQWRRTLKNNLKSDDGIKIHTGAIEETKEKIAPNLSMREEKLSKLKAKFQDDYNKMTDYKDEKEELLKKMKEKENRPIRRKITRTIKKTHKLGKKDGKVGVLIKNTKTRKQAYEEQKDLHKKPMSEIKDYLRKHELLKVGSSAPTDVIRAMYENSILAGDVHNKNSEVLVHNYMTPQT